MSSLISRILEMMMSFGNGTKLSFFLLLTRVMILPFPFARGFTNSSATVCDLFFFWYTEKQLYKMPATMAYLLAKIYAFPRYHSDESEPF